MQSRVSYVQTTAGLWPIRTDLPITGSIVLDTSGHVPTESYIQMWKAGQDFFDRIWCPQRFNIMACDWLRILFCWRCRPSLSSREKAVGLNGGVGLSTDFFRGASQRQRFSFSKIVDISMCCTTSTGCCCRQGERLSGKRCYSREFHSSIFSFSDQATKTYDIEVIF